MRVYKIADLLVGIESVREDYFPSYAPYEVNVEKMDRVELDMLINIEDVHRLTDIKGKLVFESELLTVFELEGGVAVFFDKPKPRMLIRYSKNFGDVKIEIVDTKSIKRPSDLLEYVFTGQYFHYRLALKHGVLFSGQSVGIDKNGVLFLGDKIENFDEWESFCGKDFKILCDDKSTTLFKSPEYYLASTPFSEAVKRFKLPLRAVVWHEEARDNFVARMGAKDVTRLHSKCVRSVIDKRIGDKAKQKIDFMATEIPLFLVKGKCDKDMAKQTLKVLKPFLKE